MNPNASPLGSPGRRPLFSATCLLAVLAPITVFAQTTTRSADSTRAREVHVVDTARPLKKLDRDFMDRAAKASMAEIAISRVAAARTSNPDVRRFAQMMVDYHERANEELASMAAVRGIPLPAKDPHPDKWEKRDAKNFDKDYLEKMVSDHEDVVKLFEKQAKDGDDVETVAFARKHLPKMQAHLQHALDLKRLLSDKRERR